MIAQSLRLIRLPGEARLGRMSLFRRRPVSPDEIEVIGVARAPLSDLYNNLLRAPWWLVFLGLCVTVLGANLVFALGYLAVGGIAGARPGSFTDLYFFSVQTMGTIGYGAMYPRTLPAHVLVTAEALVGISIVALTTGLLFAKFSVPRARVRFADQVVITPFNGVPTLMVRLGNERTSQIIEALVRVVLIRTERTLEGVLMYRMYDLALERERSPALTRSWTVMHQITEKSPLHGATPASLKKDEIDETSAQLLHARWRYVDSQVRWGARHVDLLSERPDGGLRLDVRRFHEVLPTQPTPTFPYPDPASS